MHIDRAIEPSRSAPARDAGRDRNIARLGHRRAYDAKRPRRDFSARVDGVVRDVAAFRVVALSDLITQHFDGHPFAGRRGIGEAEQRGWIARQTAYGPKGGRFTVFVATPAGATRAAGLWVTEGRASQRVFSGAVKTADMRHDVAVYRAVCAAQARIEAAGGHVTRIRIDAELKGHVAGQAERARQASGQAAVEARRRAAAELDLPMARGKVLFPDAQIEYVTAAGITERCNVEVASEHYGSGDIRAKAAAGFQMYAASGRAAAFVRRVLADTGSGGARSRSGRSGRREDEVFEI